MRTRRSNLSTPRIAGDTLTYREETPTGDVFHTLKVNSTEWFNWLEQKADRFYFGEENHHGFTAQKENAKRGETDWVATKRKHKRLARISLGRSDMLTLARLHAAADEIEAALNPSPEMSPPAGHEEPPTIIKNPGKARRPPGWDTRPVAAASAISEAPVGMETKPLTKIQLGTRRDRGPR